MSPKNRATHDKLTTIIYERRKGIVQVGVTEGHRTSVAEETFREEKKESLLKNQHREKTVVDANAAGPPQVPLRTGC